VCATERKGKLKQQTTAVAAGTAEPLGDEQHHGFDVEEFGGPIHWHRHGLSASMQETWRAWLSTFRLFGCTSEAISAALFSAEPGSTEQGPLAALFVLVTGSVEEARLQFQGFNLRTVTTYAATAVDPQHPLPAMTDVRTMVCGLFHQACRNLLRANNLTADSISHSQAVAVLQASAIYS